MELSRYGLEKLPDGKAVYAIYSRKSGVLGNCIFVGETEDIKKSMIAHLSDAEPNECLRTFAQAKAILLRYELMPNSNKAQRLDTELEWIDRFGPRCNKREHK
jgi:hypothetical protein